MPIVDVPGLGRVEFPAGMSEADMTAAIQGALKPAPEARSWYENAAIAAGAGMTDMARGLQQRGMEFLNYIGDLPDEQLAAFQAETAANRELMAPVMDTTAGKVGYGVGQVAAGAPTALVPGANSYAGAALLGGLYGASQPTVEGENAAVNTALGAGMGAAGQGVLNTLLAGGKRWLASRAAQNLAKVNQRAPMDRTVREAIDAGYALPPAMTNPESTTNRVLQGVSGVNKLGERMAQKNQEVTNRLAREALDLAPDEALTADLVKQKVRAEVARGYDPIRKAGPIVADRQFTREVSQAAQPSARFAADFPSRAKVDPKVGEMLDDLSSGQWDADSVVEAIRRYRKDARVNFKALGDPDKIELARVQDQVADALEGLVDRNLSAQGKQGLVDQFRLSRQKIAMANDVGEALVEASGNVDARYFGNKALAGKPLSGPLKTIGDMESLFRRGAMRINPMSLAQGSTPFSVLDLMAGSAGMGIGATTGNYALTAAALARPALRELLASGPYQRAMAIPGAPGTGLSGHFGSAVNNPLLQHALRVGGPVGLLPAGQ